MKSIAGILGALILVAATVDAAELGPMTRTTAKIDEVDAAMKQFYKETDKVDAVLCRAIHMHPTDKDVGLTESDSWEIMTSAQLYCETHRYRVLTRRITSKYLRSKDNSERLHWFMLMTAITHRENELVDLMASKEQRVLTKNIIDLFVETELDPVYYIKDMDRKMTLYKMIKEARDE